MPDETELLAQIAKLNTELDRRARQTRKLDSYYDGECPLPPAVVKAKVTRAYRMLMGIAQAPWGSLIVDSVQDRLEVTGIRSGEKRTDEALWGVWQDNQMDAESKLAHNSALIAGRAFALVWRPTGSAAPEISLDSAEQMIVQYAEGSRRRRVAALRRWTDDDAVPYCTLYRPEGLYKFKGPKNMSGMGGTQWERRDVAGETWPLSNPFGVVPVVELAVNRRLKPGSFPFARGEFEHCLPLIDRIHTLSFLGLVVAFWMGFPLRAVIGDRILEDDDGNKIAPFDAMANEVAQFEDPATTLQQFDAADRKNLSIFQELDQLATITKTPRHYMPLDHGMSNLSADAIRASEGGLIAKVPSHKGSLGEGWEEVLRLGGLMLDTKIDLSPRAELGWKDHETRALSERADAASKLKDILPWQVVAERVLNATDGDISRWEAMRSSDAISSLLADMTGPAVAAAAAAGSNGTANDAVAAR